METLADTNCVQGRKYKKKHTSHGFVSLSGIKMHVLKTDSVFSFTRLKCTNWVAINVMIIEMPPG